MDELSRSYLHKEDLKKVTFKAISLLIREHSEMPNKNASSEEIKKWISDTLGDNWFEEQEEIQPLLALPSIDSIKKEVENELIPIIKNQVQNAIPQNIKSIPTELKNLEDKIKNIGTGLEGKVEKELEKFLPHSVLQKLLKDIETAIEKGEKDIEKELQKGLKQVTKYITAIGQIAHELEYYLVRFEYAVNSLKDLALILGNNAPPEKFFNALRDLISAKKPEESVKAMLNLMELLLISSNPLFKLAEVVLNIMKGKGLSNAFPYAVAPGDLDLWINPAEAKLKGRDIKISTEIDEQERAFRLEMVAAIDHYCRGKFGGKELQSVLRAADDRLAIELIADLSSVLLSTLFGYVLRHPRLPSPTLPRLEWAHPFNHIRRADDGAAKMSITISRQITYPLKSGIGLVFRGFWDVSTLNNSLVEGVTSLISNTVSSILESFLHDFLWSVEIHETYTKPDPEKDSKCVWGWKTQEAIHTGSNGDQYLYYGVWVRPSILSETEAGILKNLITENEFTRELLQNLLQDYGAYMQSIRDYTDEDWEETGVVTDTLKITSSNSSSAVTAQSSYSKSFPSAPVLRAYYDGNCMVMQLKKEIKEGEKSTAQYECAIPVEKTDHGAIYIRSNYGGKAKHLLNT